MRCEYLGCTQDAVRWCVWLTENKHGRIKQWEVCLCAHHYEQVRREANTPTDSGDSQETGPRGTQETT